MPLFKKQIHVFALLFLIAPMSLPALAETTPIEKKISQPNPADNAVLASILTTGTKAYYLGSQGGVDGWFLVKDGQVQIGYSMKDGKSFVVGAMFGDSNQNVTSDQIKALLASNPELAEMIDKSITEKAKQPDMPFRVASPPGALGSDQGTVLAETSPGEKLLHDLSTAPGVTLGNNPNAPIIQMIMDPNCPHCRATWKQLREAVLKNILQVRLIPVAVENSENERVAARLLKAENPLEAWDKYVDGDKTQLAGPADATALQAVRINLTLITSWKIDVTPYLVYRAKDGKVKVVKGEVEKPSLLLGDLGI